MLFVKEPAFPIVLHFLLRHPNDLLAAQNGNALAGGDNAARAIIIALVLTAANGWDSSSVAGNRVAPTRALNFANRPNLGRSAEDDFQPWTQPGCIPGYSTEVRNGAVKFLVFFALNHNQPLLPRYILLDIGDSCPKSDQNHPWNSSNS